MQFFLSDETQTKQFANDLALLSHPGDIYLLTGDLGAGKTTFTKGFAKGLDIEQMIKSPTYTLIREYEQGKFPLYHMDVYRLTEGASDLGLEEYLEGDGICLIEWGQLIKDDIDVPFFEITLDKVDDHSRLLTLTSSAKELAEKLNQIETTLLAQGWQKK